jgi:hypothetical protein
MASSKSAGRLSIPLRRPAAFALQQNVDGCYAFDGYVSDITFMTFMLSSVTVHYNGPCRAGVQAVPVKFSRLVQHAGRFRRGMNLDGQASRSWHAPPRVLESHRR